MKYLKPSQKVQITLLSCISLLYCFYIGLLFFASFKVEKSIIIFLGFLFLALIFMPIIIIKAIIKENKNY